MIDWKGLAHSEVRVGIDVNEVQDLLASLTEKCLVGVDQNGRCYLLESVRDYGRGLLTDGGEVAAIRGRHSAYYLSVAEEADPNMRGSAQKNWLERLEADHDNLRSALEWSGQQSDAAEPALRLAGALWRFWSVRGYFGEGRDRLFRALALEPCKRNSIRAKALNAAGILVQYLGDYATARALYEECLSISRELDDRRWIAIALGNLGTTAAEQGDYAAARALYEGSLTITRELGDRRVIAGTLVDLGNVAKDLGDCRAARELYEESLTIMRELGDRRGVAGSQCNLALVALQQGDHPVARMLIEESLATFRELGDRWSEALSIKTLGNIAQEQGDLSTALESFGKSLTIFGKLGDRRSIANSLEGLAIVFGRLGNCGRAACVWGAAVRLREDTGAPIPPNEQARFDKQVAAARAALGDDAAFDAAWARGRAMTMGQAIDFALKTHV